RTDTPGRPEAWFGQRRHRFPPPLIERSLTMTTPAGTSPLPTRLDWLWDDNNQTHRQAIDHLLGLAPTRSSSPRPAAFAPPSAARRRAAEAGMTYTDFDAAIDRARHQWGATSEVEAVRACLRSAMANPASPIFGVAPAD